MWYIGTYQECLDYNTQVNNGENYVDNTTWATPIQSQIDANKWAILKACPENCPRTYEADMQDVDTLPEEFINQDPL